MDFDDEKHWSKTETASLSRCESGSEFSCSSPVSDKKARHNIVERNRRDKTRAFVENLQALLPNIADHRPNPNINFVLEKALEYLQSEPKDCTQPLDRADGTFSTENEIETRPTGEIVQSIKNHLASQLPCCSDTSPGRYFFSFENAPFGIVMAKPDGFLTAANGCFREMFLMPQGPLVGFTMFKLTSSQDMPKTMQVLARHLGASCARGRAELGCPLENAPLEQCDRHGERRRSLK